MIEKNAAGLPVTFRLLNNHIFIDVMVNGKGPFPFFVDTGGHDILTPSTAAALGLKPKGATISGGAGAKTQLSGYTKVHTLGMGAATMSDQTVLILDMSPVAVEGFQPGGMVSALPQQKCYPEGSLPHLKCYQRAHV